MPRSPLFSRVFSRRRTLLREVGLKTSCSTENAIHVTRKGRGCLLEQSWPPCIGEEIIVRMISAGAGIPSRNHDAAWYSIRVLDEKFVKLIRIRWTPFLCSREYNGKGNLRKKVGSIKGSLVGFLRSSCSFFFFFLSFVNGFCSSAK